MTYSPTYREEFANSLTHGIGLLLGVVGIPILISSAVHDQNSLHLWGVSIFGFSLLMLYLFSTLYHSIQHPETKKILRIFDHISIYFLIAGTYTPFIFFFLNDSTGYIFLILLWTFALLGSVLKIFFTGRFNKLSTLMYVGMGWTIVFIGKPIFSAMSFEGILWVVIGGLAYTLGVVFYLWHRLKYHHAIWHLFVLAGTLSHFIAILYSLDFLSKKL